MSSPDLDITYFMFYLLALLLSFYMAFYVVMRYTYGYSMRTKMRYATTAGLLSTKFIVFIASLLGIDRLLVTIIIGKVIVIPITANTILFLSNLAAVISLNWDRVKQWLVLPEEL